MIRAETHPDDHAREIEFDATKWFEQASDEEILALARTDPMHFPNQWDDVEDAEVWGQDQESDVVALYMADHVPNVADMFEYIAEWVTTKIGFECYILANDAREWIAEHRPGILAELPERPETFVISPPGTPKERIIGAAEAIQKALPDIQAPAHLSYGEVRAIRGYAENILIQAGKLHDRSGTGNPMG